MARGRPTNIVTILTETLKCDRTHTVREIAIMPPIAAAYKDYNAAYSAIRQLLVNKLGLSPAGRRGEDDSGPMYFRSDDILTALGVTPQPREPRPAAPERLGARRLPRSGTALVAAALLVVTALVWMTRSADEIASIEDRIEALAVAGDLDGLRDLERSLRVTRDLREEEDLETETGTIRAAFGADLRPRFPPLRVEESPYRVPIAARIAALETGIHHLQRDQIVAVLPGLETWLFTTPDGIVPVRIGTHVKIGGYSGYVNRVTAHHLFLSTDMGETAEIGRDQLFIMRQGEQPGLKTVIYPHPAGNLDGLLGWIADQLGVHFVDRSEPAGQIAGFFPPFDSLEALVAELGDLGVHLSDDALTVSSPRGPRLHLGFYQTRVYIPGTIEEHLRLMAGLLPQELTWPVPERESYWYSGQQLDTMIEQLHLTALYRRDAGWVLIGEK